MSGTDAKVLLVGSHPMVTRHVARTLREAGWNTVTAVGPEAGIEALAQHDIDLMVLGGPLALQARKVLTEALKRSNPWGMVVIPAGATKVVDAVASAYGESQ